MLTRYVRTRSGFLRLSLPSAFWCHAPTPVAMITQQQVWTSRDGWTVVHGDRGPIEAQLVLVFGGGETLEDPGLLAHLAAEYPRAEIVGCSTAGEIGGDEVRDDSLVATAIQFDRTGVRVVAESLPDASESVAVGEAIAASLQSPTLGHVLLFSEGIHVDHMALLQGMAGVLGDAVGITGGLAGDSVHFRRTLVLAGGTAETRRVAAVGLYGASLTVGYGTLGGWDPYGPARLVTSSSGCVVHTMDGEPALDLFSRYIGEHASALPGSAVRFPFAMRAPGSVGEVVRTVCAVDREARSLTFAGGVPAGATLRLMRANVERLIDAATAAATASTARMGGGGTALALLVSCVGRKLLMGAHVDEEVACVRDIIGRDGACTGFYSYGEVAPLRPQTRSELHNQTMTITTFAER